MIELSTLNAYLRVMWSEYAEEKGVRLYTSPTGEMKVTGPVGKDFYTKEPYRAVGEFNERVSALGGSLEETGGDMEDLEKDKEPEMLIIPPGEFWMGSALSEPQRNENEGPQHRVRIEQPFEIGKYAVTIEEYDAFAQATGRDKPADEGWGWGLGRGRRPVINVSWEDATAYTKWLSEQTGKRYRLPSEAEWEYAARAGTTTPFHTGERITTEQANFNGNDTYNGSAKGEYRKKTVAVGSFPANAFGLHDMHGNVWEWVQDCWHDNYEGAPEDGSAWESGDCEWRVVRGGSWYDRPWWLRSAFRYGYGPTYRYYDGGFRLARTL